MVDGRHSGLLCEVQALEAQEEGRSGKHRAAAPRCAWGKRAEEGGGEVLACLLPACRRLPVPRCLPALAAAERARVRLLPSYEVVTVRCKELGEREDKTREERERERPGSRGGGSSGRGSREGEDERDQRRHKQDRHREEERGGSKRGEDAWTGCPACLPCAPPALSSSALRHRTV